MLLVFCLCKLEDYEDPIRIFYANLCLSPDNGELETLMLGTRIILNDFLFEKVFDTKFSGVIHFMNGSWPEDFEISFEKAKKFMFNLDTMSAGFGPLSLCFKHRIMAHIIATTLISRKGSLSNIACRDVFVLYCMVKRHKINWIAWIREYMLESAVDVFPSISLLYELLITQILLCYSIDLSTYLLVEVFATYDSKTFANMGYVLVKNEWCKKNSSRAKSNLPKVIMSISNPMLPVLKELEYLKNHFKTNRKE